MSYDVLENLKTDINRLRLLAIQEEWYVIFEGGLDSDEFEEYHKISQDLAFSNCVRYWKKLKDEQVWNEVLSTWGEHYVVSAWLNDKQSTEQLEVRVNSFIEKTIS